MQKIITCGFQSIDTNCLRKKTCLKVKFSIRNLEKYWRLKTAISINYCYILNTNEQVQRQNFDSERY
jgi:hypothetical protein